MANKNKMFPSLDGIRAYSAIGIVLMHVKANMPLNFSGYVYDRVIATMSGLVFLFMILSAFSLSCGYYEKFKLKEITPDQFYKRRYMRILPFFAILVLIAAFIPHSPNQTAVSRSSDFILGSSPMPHILQMALEAFLNITMLFGFLPNFSMSVMGVGWFLGIIFIFYIFYPFFVFLIDNRFRAWMMFFISLLICLSCMSYFFTDKFISFSAVPRSFLYNLPFFMAGGLIYLYRDFIYHITSKNQWLWWILSILLTIIYWEYGHWNSDFAGVIVTLLTMSIWVCLAIGYEGVLLSNRILRYLSSISMEIYLCHMMCFRAVSYFHFDKFFSNIHLAYIAVCILTLLTAIIFSHVVKYCLIESMVIGKLKLYKVG